MRPPSSVSAVTWLGHQSPRRLRNAALAGLALGATLVFLEALGALVVPAMIGVLLLLVLVQALIPKEHDETRRRILRWTMLAFAGHLLFGLASTNISTTVRFYLGTDSFGYDNIARQMVEHWTAGLPFPTVPHGKEGFYYLLAGLYWVFGPHTAAGLAVNATLAAALVPVMYDVTNRLFGPSAAKYAAILVIVTPSLFLWTSQLMKESAMIFLLAVALNAAVRLVDRVSVGALILLAGTLLLTFTFRAWIALVAAAGLMAGLAFGRTRLVSGLSTGFSILSIVAAVMVASGLGYSGYQAAVNSDLDQAQIVRKDLAVSAGTGYDVETDISSTGQALSYLPVGLFNFTFGPFPWNIRSARQLPFVPDMLMWWALLPSLWGGFRSAARRVGRKQLILVLPAGATTLLLSLALGNFGIVVRERLQVFIFLVPLIALGLAERAARRKRAAVDVPAGPPLATAGRMAPQH